MSMPRSLGGVSAGALLVAGCDQLIKELVLRSIAPGEFLAVVPGICWLTIRHNPGAAFSLLQEAPIGVLILLNLAVLIGFLLIVRPYMGSRLGGVATACILGGALGNLIDRVRWHYVVDYLEVRLTPTYTWPTFNLADACVVIGVGLLGIVLWRSEHPRGTPADPEAPSPGSGAAGAGTGSRTGTEGGRTAD
jgi:signal peptidase II